MYVYTNAAVNQKLAHVPMGPSGFLWGSYGFQWIPLDSYGVLWIPYGSRWNHMHSNVIWRMAMGSYRFLWRLVRFHGRPRRRGKNQCSEKKVFLFNPFNRSVFLAPALLIYAWPAPQIKNGRRLKSWRLAVRPTTTTILLPLLYLLLLVLLSLLLP